MGFGSYSLGSNVVDFPEVDSHLLVNQISILVLSKLA